MLNEVGRGLRHEFRTIGIPVPGAYDDSELRRFQNPVNFHFRQWKVLFYGIQDFFKINTEILVDEEMPHGNDILPGNFPVLFLEFR
jgi:hypothetical protein